MPGIPIEKGTPQARLVMSMIYAWFDDEFSRLDEFMDEIGGDYGVVFRLLIVVLGGLVQSIATYAGKKYEEVLPQILAQMAPLTTDQAAAELAREALTAWSFFDDVQIANLNFDEAILRVGPKEVLIHFLGMIRSITQSWSKQSGVPMHDILAGWAMALGESDD